MTKDKFKDEAERRYPDKTTAGWKDGNYYQRREAFIAGAEYDQSQQPDVREVLMAYAEWMDKNTLHGSFAEPKYYVDRYISTLPTDVRRECEHEWIPIINTTAVVYECVKCQKLHYGYFNNQKP